MLSLASRLAKSRLAAGLPASQPTDMAAGELNDILQDKYTFVHRAHTDGSWRRLWNTKEVLAQLSKLHMELFQVFTLQMLTANFMVRWRMCP